MPTQKPNNQNNHQSGRSFFQIKRDSKQHAEETTTYFTDGMRYVHDNLIGQNVMITGPFGERRMTYADYTASGRNLRMIENYISKYVYSYYANTHTTTSFTSLQTSRFREDARDIIRNCCNASDKDAVIFCGSGATAAIHKLIGTLSMSDPDVASKAVVFIGPYEHHSNILPWKETGAKIVRIAENRRGQLDEEQLEQELKNYQHGQEILKVGTFSACSNVTGLLANTVRISQLMHRYGGLVFWDYAAGAPYLEMDMNPLPVASYKDAMFCSPHKFVGGPGSPGVLIAKKKLFTNQTPHHTGGGTVVYVTSKQHIYTKDIEAREEGGTPAIIESIRTGLVFQLKQSIGVDNIRNREAHLAKRGISVLKGNPNVILLGSKVSPRVPILSFIIKHPPTKKIIHHNFVALVLNELFGIQTRGGCACAGPYTHDLLGMAEEATQGISAFVDDDIRNNSVMIGEDGREEPLSQELKIAKSLGIMKPGFVRVNLAYFMTDNEVSYILKAITMVANEGWKLLPQYSYNVENGSWQHKHTAKKRTPLMSLFDINYERTVDFSMTVQGVINPKSSPGKQQSYGYIVEEAERIFSSAAAESKRLYSYDETTLTSYLPESLLGYVWWLEPQYAVLMLDNKAPERLDLTHTIPIKPRVVSGPVQLSELVTERSKTGTIITPRAMSQQLHQKSSQPEKRTTESSDKIVSKKPGSTTTIKKERTRVWVEESSKRKPDEEKPDQNEAQYMYSITKQRSKSRRRSRSHVKKLHRKNKNQ